MLLLETLKLHLRGWRIALALGALAEGPVWFPAPTQCGSQPPIIPVPRDPTSTYMDSDKTFIN